LFDGWQHENYSGWSLAAGLIEKMRWQNATANYALLLATFKGAAEIFFIHW
jgi:hypothetical protein